MSVWSMLAECVGQLDEPFRRSEIIGWFRWHYPQVKESTLAAHIQAATPTETATATIPTWPDEPHCCSGSIPASISAQLVPS